MIKLVDESNYFEVCKSIENTLLGTKIICQLNAYGTDKDFLTAWCCYDEEKITAVFCRFDSSLTLVMLEESAAEDVSLFLGMLDYSSLCCCEKDAVRLGYACVALKKSYFYSGEMKKVTAKNLTEESYRSYYTVVCENIPDSFDNTKEAYLSFISDFTYRKNRSLARAKGFTDGDGVIAGALTSAETENSAVISAVACKSSSRNKGLGKETVLSLVSELISENKKVYVIALNESAQGFYEHIGFEYIENIAFIERK